MAIAEKIGFDTNLFALHPFEKRKIPIIVGGTGLYFNTITRGISKIPDIAKIIEVRVITDIFSFKKKYPKIAKKIVCV